MELKILDFELSICKVVSANEMDWQKDFYFVAKTDEEFSIVCKTVDVPLHTVIRSDGWRGFRIEGVLDFSLTGILAQLSGILAEHKIGIFAVSTYNTDYILVKSENLEHAMKALKEQGYIIHEKTDH